MTCSWKERRDGFTLVETVVMMVILSILAAIAIPSYQKYIETAKEQAYIAEARQVSNGVQSYLIEKYGAGPIRGTNITADLMMYELGNPRNALTELLKGAYTPGGLITYIGLNKVTGEYLGMTYKVEGYIIEIVFGKEIRVTRE